MTVSKLAALLQAPPKDITSLLEQGWTTHQIIRSYTVPAITN